MSGRSETAFARTIAAIDMTGNPELRGLWFPGTRVPVDLASRAGFPAEGFPSPLGYWIVKHDGLAPPSSTGLRMVVTGPGEEAPEFAAKPDESRQAGRQFRMQTVKIKAPGPDTGDVVLMIGPGTARVVARESTWDVLAEPIIFAVCQVWRFQSIEAEIEHLTASALEDLSYANVPGLASLGESRRLMDLGGKTRTAIVDLTYFQMLLTDPLAYFDSRRSARVFRLLCDRFGLDDWSNSIDHRAELVEATYETITEKLYHLRSHAHDVVLEAIIVGFLLIDILMRIWEAMV